MNPTSFPGSGTPHWFPVQQLLPNDHRRPAEWHGPRPVGPQSADHHGPIRVQRTAGAQPGGRGHPGVLAVAWPTTIGRCFTRWFTTGWRHGRLQTGQSYWSIFLSCLSIGGLVSVGLVCSSFCCNAILNVVFTVHLESIQTPWLFPHCYITALF